MASFKDSFPRHTLPQVPLAVATELRMFGMQRSGNSAVISWLVTNARPKHGIVKANNTSFIAHGTIHIPYDRGTGPFITTDEADGISIYAANSFHLYQYGAKGQLVFRSSPKRNVTFGEEDDQLWIQNNEDPRWDDELKDRLKSGNIQAAVEHVIRMRVHALQQMQEMRELGKLPQTVDMLVYQNEDVSPRVIDHVPYSSGVFAARSTSIFNVFVIRDFHNWAASRIASGRNVDRIAVDLWKEYAELAREQSFRKGTLVINFNAFVQQHDYREQIAHVLGLSSCDLSTENSVAGGGSSFPDGGDRRKEVLKRVQHLRPELKSVYDAIINEFGYEIKQYEEIFN